MNKPYCSLITAEQNAYIDWLCEKLETSRSCTMSMLIESYGLFSVNNKGKILFEKKELKPIYDQEYQHKRSDLVYKLKVYTNKNIFGNSSQYIRTIIRYAMMRDEVYIKESQTTLENRNNPLDNHDER